MLLTYFLTAVTAVTAATAVYHLDVAIRASKIRMVNEK